MKPVNLLPDEYRARKRREGDSRPGVIVIAVLGVVLLMTAVYAFSINSANGKKTAIAGAKADIERAQSQIASEDSYGSFHDIKETRLASVKQLAAGRFDWERLMRELARVLPSGTWLTDINASASGTDSQSSGGGAAPSPAAPAASPSASTASSSSSASSSASSSSSSTPSGQGQSGSSDPSVHLMGCALHQHDVAVVLVRLRQLHRASDVDLAESAEETTDASGTAATASSGGDDSCGNGRFKFDVTVTFAPSAPAAGALDTKAPASLGGGS